MNAMNATTPALQAARIPPAGAGEPAQTYFPLAASNPVVVAAAVGCPLLAAGIILLHRGRSSRRSIVPADHPMSPPFADPASVVEEPEAVVSSEFDALVTSDPASSSPSTSSKPSTSSESIATADAPNPSAPKILRRRESAPEASAISSPLSSWSHDPRSLSTEQKATQLERIDLAWSQQYGSAPANLLTHKIHWTDKEARPSVPVRLCSYLVADVKSNQSLVDRFVPQFADEPAPLRGQFLDRGVVRLANDSMQDHWYLWYHHMQSVLNELSGVTTCVHVLERVPDTSLVSEPTSEEGEEEAVEEEAVEEEEPVIATDHTSVESPSVTVQSMANASVPSVDRSTEPARGTKPAKSTPRITTNTLMFGLMKRDSEKARKDLLRRQSEPSSSAEEMDSDLTVAAKDEQDPVVQSEPLADQAAQPSSPATEPPSRSSLAEDSRAALRRKGFKKGRTAQAGRRRRWNALQSSRKARKAADLVKRRGIHDAKVEPVVEDVVMEDVEASLAPAVESSNGIVLPSPAVKSTRPVRSSKPAKSSSLITAMLKKEAVKERANGLRRRAGRSSSAKADANVKLVEPESEEKEAEAPQPAVVPSDTSSEPAANDPVPAAEAEIEDEEVIFEPSGNDDGYDSMASQPLAGKAERTTVVVGRPLRPSSAYISGQKLRMGEGLRMMRNALNGDVSKVHALTAILKKERQNKGRGLKRVISSQFQTAWVDRTSIFGRSGDEPKPMEANPPAAAEAQAEEADDDVRPVETKRAGRLRRELHSTLDGGYWAIGDGSSKRPRRRRER